MADAPVTKQQPRCRYCNSTDVTIGAIAEWDNEQQDWVICGTYDNDGFCRDCEKEQKYFNWEDVPCDTATSDSPSTSPSETAPPQD